MYVIYHSSDSFASVTGVSMASLFENNQSMDHIHVLYIERGMTENNKRKLLEIANKYGRELEFMEMPNWSERLGIQLKSCKKGWLGFGYNRLFLTEFLPEDIDKVLYLDSDTIVEHSLEELWNTDLSGYYVAGVDDCLSSKYRKLVGLGDEGVYINAGMLLINVKKWREENVCQMFIDDVVKNNGYYVFNEQSIINSLFAGHVKILPQNYNVNSLVYLYDYDELMALRKPHKYSDNKRELNDAKTNPYITHFTGNFFVKRRPWIENSDHPHAAVFLEYRKLSPWCKEPLLKDNRSIKSVFWTGICHILPRKIMINLVSFLYNDLRTIALKRKIEKSRA